MTYFVELKDAPKPHTLWASSDQEALRKAVDFYGRELELIYKDGGDHMIVTWSKQC